MGLIKAITGAVGGTFADQWKEFFYCDALDKNVLVTKGQKRVSGRSSNTKGNDNIISNGSGIAVADGQCMIIVEQGKVVDLCAEPGEYTYDKSSEPSIFTGPLGKSVLDTFKTIGKRFTFGGDTAKDQRVYYFNTKEIIDNKFGTPNPILFRFVDSKIGLDVDMSVRCSGVYSYVISDPLLFYTNVCGNVESEYTRDEIEGQLKTEFVSALSPALGKLSELELRPNQIPSHTTELESALNDALSEKWGTLRGLKVKSVALNPISLSKEDEDLIKTAQKGAMFANTRMAAAQMASAQADAMRAAASNENGAVNGFMGMGMVGGMGNNVGNLFTQAQAEENAAAAKAKTSAPAGDTWKCACGNVVSGKFCTECGAKRPEDGWKCSCGNVNKGKFCPNCGAKKPEGAPLYRCDKCGWEPEDPAHPPKFCPECGDIFDDSDKQ